MSNYVAVLEATFIVHLVPPFAGGARAEIQAAAGGGADVERATLAVQTHLARIAQHRRLDHIADSTQQQQAEAVRAWYLGAFLDAAGSRDC